MNKPNLGRQVNWSHPLAKGLVGCWLMNEGGGNKVFDLSGNGNNGTITNALWTPGKFGSALNFSGDVGYITISAPPISNSITYIAWINTDVGSETAQVVFRILDTLLRIYLTGLDWYPDIDTTVVSFAYTFAAGTYYQIAVTQNGTIYALYINGVQVKTGETVALDVIGVLNFIGNYNGASGLWDFDGIIDLPMIFNRALSASEIAQLYREPFCMFEPSYETALMKAPAATRFYDSTLRVNRDRYHFCPACRQAGVRKVDTPKI